MISTAEIIAEKFNEVYERLAPEHNVDTGRDSTDWEDIPEHDRNYMIAIMSELLDSGVIAAGESILV